jgi:hypothetical protein
VGRRRRLPPAAMGVRLPQIGAWARQARDDDGTRPSPPGDEASTGQRGAATTPAQAPPADLHGGEARGRGRG